MAYDPNEVAKPKRTLLSQLSDEGGLGMKIARQGLTAPVQVLEAVAGLPGLLHGGIGFVNEAGNKALHLRNQDKTYEQLRDKAFERMARPMEVAANVLPFGKEAEEAMNDTIGWIFSHLQAKGAEYGDKNLEATGSPLMATIAHTSFEGLPYLGAEALGMKAAKGAVRMAKEGVLPRAADMVPSAKEFRSQLATPKPVQPEVIPPTRFLNSQHLDLPETSNFDKPPITRDVFNQQMKDSFGISEEHASAVQAVVEARARQWANETGYLPQDYYPMFFEEIAQGGEHGPGALFQRDPEYAATWYSHLEKVIESPKFPNRAPGEQMANALDSWAKSGDIKPEELEWTGTSEWLRNQKGPVTKQEVLAHVRQNKLDIQELVLDEGDTKSISDAWDAVEAYRDEMNKKYLVTGQWWQQHAKPEERAVYDDLVKKWDDLYSRPRAKFKGWKQGGGENYREMLLTVPDNKFARVQFDPKLIDSIDPGRVTVMSPEEYWKDFSGIDMEDGMYHAEHYHDLRNEFTAKYTGVEKFDRSSGVIFHQRDGKFRVEFDETDSGRVYDTRDEALRTIKQHAADALPKDSFVGSHWEEPNVLAHTRLTDRTDANGKRVLFVEEIQSDWHQGGRDEGYINQDVADGYRRHDELEKEMFKRYDEADSLEERGDMEGATRAREEAERLKEEKYKYADQVNKYLSGVPNAPMKSTKAWSMLVMKRLVRYAAEHGYDKIAWTNGKQQNKMYSLSTHVDSLIWNRDRWGNYNLKVRPTDLDLGDSSRPGIPKEDLHKYIGKELADKIISNDSASQAGVLRGLDLEIGGEGMRGFYDNILPNETKRFFGKKQWGNAEVGKTTLEFPDEKHNAEPRYEGPEYSVEQLRQMAEEHFGAAKTEGMALQDQIRHAELGEKFYRILNDMEVGDVPFGEAVANHVTRAVLDELGGRIRPGSKKIDSIDVHSMDVTPEMRQKALSEGMPLFSKEGGRIKGSTEFLANGKAIIRAYQGADVKTALHEVGHVFRSEIEKTNPKLMEKIKKDFDAQDGWHVKAEEDFTEAFLKWLETGERKNAFHENAFARFKNWLVNTYKTFAGKAVVGDAIKDFFDNTIRIKDIEKAEIEAKTIGGILDKYSPDNITDAAYITSRGKPVGNTTEGGHASTIENVTAEMGWHELFLNEDLGREETVRRTKLITRVAMEGENLFVTGESVMSRAEARAAVKKYITNARIEEAVVDYDGEQYVVKAGKFKALKEDTTPKPKPERIKFQKPTKENPLNNTDYKTPLREVIDKGKNIMSDKEYLRLTDEAMARGDLAAYDKAGLIRGVQATRRNTINQAKKFAEDLKADLPNDIHWSVREVIERLRDGIDPTFRSDKREVSLRRTEKFLRENTEMLKNMPTRIINLLRKRSIKDMTLEELAEIHHQIFNQENGLIKLGQLKFKLENAKLTRMREAEISKLGDSLGKSKDGKTYLNKEAISSHPLEVRKQTILDRVRAGYFGTLIPQQVFDILDGGANFGGAFHTLLYKHANRAVNYEMELARTSVDGGAAKLKQLGLDWHHWNKRSTVAGMDLSRQEMLQIHLGWMNPAYRQALRDTYSITDIKAADIEAALTKKELAFGNYVLEDYAKAAPLIDRTMQRTSNKTLKYETKYTPMMWAGDEFMKRSFEEMLNMEAGARDLARRAAPAAPFIKERVGIPEGDVKLDLRLVDNWLKNVVKRSHYISHAEYIKQIGTILSDQRVTRGIEQKFGMPAVDYLRNYVNDLANPSVVKGMQRWEQVSRLLRRNVASAYIAINPTSVAIQVASLPKYLKDAGLYNISSSLTKFILNPRKMYKRICDWEPQIRDRFFEREAAEMGELHKTKTGKSIDMLQSTGMWPTKMMDKIMVIVGYDATYNRFVNKIGHEAAKEKALEVTLRTQSATHVKDQAPLYKAGEAANWMTLFTNDLNKTWGEVIHTLPADLRAGRLRDAGYTMAGLGTMAIIAWYVGHQFTLPDSPADIADAFTEQALSTLPLVGNVAMAKKAGYDDTGNPAISALALPGKIASADSTKSKAKETFESASVLFGLPYTFTRKTAESIHEGSFKPYLGRGRENPFEKDTAVKTHSSRKFLGRSSGRGGRKFLK